MDTHKLKMASTFIPDGNYLSITQVAKILGVEGVSIQYHVGKGNLPTIKVPGMGHIIREGDIDSLRQRMRQRQKNENNTSYNYLIQADLPSNPCKIGKANKLRPRLSIFGSKLPFEWKLIHSFESDNPKKSEEKLHKKYTDSRLKGEWFNLSEKEIEDIKGIRYYQDGKFHTKDR